MSTLSFINRHFFLKEWGQRGLREYMLVSRAYLYMQRNRLHPGLANIEDHAELAFSVLSLTAKTVLCWIVLSPILF